MIPELETASKTVFGILNPYCDKTPCVKCYPRMEIGTCPYEKLQSIFNALKMCD